MFVFGAIWINAATSKYVARIKDIENMEKGGAFHVTKKISDPPKLEDFADLQLPDEDIRDLRGCKVGDCEVKLSATALQTLRSQSAGIRRQKTRMQTLRSVISHLSTSGAIARAGTKARHLPRLRRPGVRRERVSLDD